MNILHVVHGFAPEFVGGTESYVETLARAWLDRGEKGAVCSGAGKVVNRARVEHVVQDGVPVHRIYRENRFLSEWFASASADLDRRYLSVLRSVQPDLVHVHHWMRLGRGLVRGAAFLGIPAVVTLHDTWSTCLRGHRLLDEDVCRRPLNARDCAECAGGLPHHPPAELEEEARLFIRDLRAELRTARAILAPTDALKELIREGLEAPELAIEKLPLPPLDTVRTSTDPAPAATEGPLRVVFWGHLDPGKGALVLVEAVARLGREGRAVTLDLYGDSITPDYVARIRSTLIELTGKADAVWHGPFQPSDLRGDRFDVAVFPSLFPESHSFVVDEAWRLGLPVVVPDRGAFPERLRDNGGGGILFRPADAEDLARVLGTLCDDREELARLRGEAAFRGPSMEDHLDALTAVYEAAIRRGTPAVPTGWTPPRGSERLLERKLCHRDPLVETLADQNRALGILQQEIEAHQGVIRKLTSEVEEHHRSLEVVEADLERHREVLREKERDLSQHRAVVEEQRAELGRHREVLDHRERELERHREVLRERETEVENYRKVVAEHERLREDLQASIEEHRKVLRELTDEDRRKGEAIRALESDLDGHRKLVIGLAADLTELAAVAREIFRDRDPELTGDAASEDGDASDDGEKDPVSPYEQLAEAVRVIRERFQRELVDRQARPADPSSMRDDSR